MSPSTLRGFRRRWSQRAPCETGSTVWHRLFHSRLRLPLRRLAARARQRLGVAKASAPRTRSCPLSH
eukprot:8498855-Alexandrium_andersonii.AAC.1